MLRSVWLVPVIAVLSCGGTTVGSGTTSGDGPWSPTVEPSTPQPLPANCDAPGGLFGVTEVLSAANHPCHDWVTACRGRLVRSGGMSAALWTSATEAGSTLLVSAVHTLGEGWFAAGGMKVPVSLRDPSREHGVVRLHLAGDSGEARSDGAAMFMLFNPAIPAAETSHKMTRIRPRHDFFVALIDDQRLKSNMSVAQVAAPLRRASAEVSDPKGWLRAAPTYQEPVAGSRVLMMGYPTGGPFAGRMAASVGVLLNDDEIAAAIQELRTAGDEEGSVAYDGAVERMVRGTAITGMSGGPVFGADGQLIGILVRASTQTAPPGYVRIVRLGLVAESLRQAHEALPPEENAAVTPFLPKLSGATEGEPPNRSDSTGAPQPE